MDESVAGTAGDESVLNMLGVVNPMKPSMLLYWSSSNKIERSN